MNMFSIKEIRLKRSDVMEKMKAIIAKDSDESPLSDEDVASFEKLKEECDRLEARINRLSAVKEDEAAGADETDDDAEKAWHGNPHKDRSGYDYSGKSFNINTSNKAFVTPKGPGDQIGRWMIGQYHVKMGGLTAGKDIVMKTWGDNMVAKSLMSTSLPIIPQDFNPNMIELLQPHAVVRQIGPYVHDMSRGNLTMFRQSLGSTATWIGQGNQIGVSNQNFDNIQFTFRKLAAMSAATREALEYPTVNLASIVANDLARRIGLAEDLTFLTATSQSGNAPNGIPGLLNSNNKISDSGAGSPTFQTVSADLQAAELQMTANMVDGPFVWIMHPVIPAFLKQLSSTYGVFPFKDELNKPEPTLNGWRVFTTAQLATNLSSADKTNILLVKPEHLIIADAMRYAVSMTTDGSWLDGSTQMNAFGQDLVGWKCTNELDFNIMHDCSAAQLTCTNWTVGSYSAAGQSQYIQSQNTGASSASSASA